MERRRIEEGMTTADDDSPPRRRTPRRLETPPGAPLRRRTGGEVLADRIVLRSMNGDIIVDDKFDTISQIFSYLYRRFQCTGDEVLLTDGSRIINYREMDPVLDSHWTVVRVPDPWKTWPEVLTSPRLLKFVEP